MSDRLISVSVLSQWIEKQREIFDQVASANVTSMEQYASGARAVLTNLEDELRRIKSIQE